MPLISSLIRRINRVWRNRRASMDSDDTQMRCPRCYKTFSTKSNLNRHMQRKNKCDATARVHPCRYCANRYITKFGLTRHEEKCAARPAPDDAGGHSVIDELFADDTAAADTPAADTPAADPRPPDLVAACAEIAELRAQVKQLAAGQSQLVTGQHQLMTGQTQLASAINKIPAAQVTNNTTQIQINAIIHQRVQSLVDSRRAQCGTRIPPVPSRDAQKLLDDTIPSDLHRRDWPSVAPALYGGFARLTYTDPKAPERVDRYALPNDDNRARRLTSDGWHDTHVDAEVSQMVEDLSATLKAQGAARATDHQMRVMCNIAPAALTGEGPLPPALSDEMRRVLYDAAAVILRIADGARDLTGV